MSKFDDIKIYSPYKRLVNKAIDEFIVETGRKPVLLDAGCGHSPVLRKEYAKCERVIGVDLDREGLGKNKWVDEKIYGDMVNVPLEDGSVDIVVSAWVLEHIENSEGFTKEVGRLLSSAGRFVSIAPNKWSLYSLVTRVVPNSWHGPIVKVFYGRPEHDTFPTFFRMNTEKELDRLFLETGLEQQEFIYNDSDRYIGFSFITKPLSWLWQAIVTPRFMRRIRAHVIVLYKKVS